MFDVGYFCVSTTILVFRAGVHFDPAGPFHFFFGAFGVMLVPELAVPTLREDFPEDSAQCPMGYHFFWSGLGHGGQAHQLRVSGSFAGLIVTQLDGNRGCHLSAQLLLSDPCPANSRCGGFPGPAALSPLLMESPGAPHPFLNLKTAPHLAGRAAFSPVCQDRCLSLPDVWCLTGSDFYVFLFSTVFCCCFPRQGGEQVSPFLAAASLPEAGSSRLPIFFVFCFLQLSYSQCLWESFLTIISTSLSFYIHF